MQNAVRGEVLFSESQRFRQAWLWLIVLLIGGGMWLLLIMHVLRPNLPEERWSVFVTLAAAWLLVGIALPVSLWLFELRVEVRRDGLYYRFVPFHLRTHSIAIGDIADFEARRYRPILEYGGWGIRYGLKGRAYNVSGNRGVQLTLTNGKRILIGSQRPDELAAALAQARSAA